MCVEETMDGATRTILHVEDDRLVREGVADSLEFFGYQVVSANDGHDGVAKFKQLRDRIDLIILDLTMPTMSGSEAFAVLRQLAPTIPIVVMSGYARRHVEHQLDGETFGFVMKPFRIEELFDVLRKQLALSTIS